MGIFKKKEKSYPEGYEDDLEAIIEILKENDLKHDKPLTYDELSNITNLTPGRVKQIIGIRFTELTKSATRGFPDQDFYIIGDNVEPISKNMWYDVIKRRLEIKIKRGI